MSMTFAKPSCLFGETNFFPQALSKDNENEV
jgi:hypothetical protein